MRLDLMAVLETKVDRPRVHELSKALTILSGTLQLAVKTSEIMQDDAREMKAMIADHGHRLDGHDGWRNKILGGFAVAGFFLGYFIRAGVGV